MSKVDTMAWGRFDESREGWGRERVREKKGVRGKEETC